MIRNMALRFASVSKSYRVEAIREGGGFDAMLSIWIFTLGQRRHHSAFLFGDVPPPAVAEAEQVAIAPFRHSCVCAEGPGTMVNSTND